MAVVTFPIHVGLCRKYGVWVNETREQAIEELEDYKKTLKRLDEEISVGFDPEIVANNAMVIVDLPRATVDQLKAMEPGRLCFDVCCAFPEWDDDLWADFIFPAEWLDEVGYYDGIDEDPEAQGPKTAPEWTKDAESVVIWNPNPDDLSPSPYDLLDDDEFETVD